MRSFYRLIPLFTIVLNFFSAAFPVYAQQQSSPVSAPIQTISGASSRLFQLSEFRTADGQTASLHFREMRFELRYQFWTLLGEPMYALAARWLEPGTGTYPTFYDAPARHAFPRIERYPDLLEQLRNMKPLEMEFLATIDSSGHHPGAPRRSTVRLVVDLPARYGEWSANLIPTSPDWDKWIPEESYRTSVLTRPEMEEQLKDLFRRQLALRDQVTIKEIVLDRLEWPEGTLQMLYREYRRREEEHAAAGQSRSPEVAGRAAALEAMRRKAQGLGSAGKAAEISTGANGETFVTASSALAGASVVVVEGRNERRVTLTPGRGVSLGRLPPEAEVRIENRGFVLEQSTISAGNHPSIQSLPGHWLLRFEYQGTDYGHEAWFSFQGNQLTGNGGYPAGQRHTFGWNVVKTEISGSEVSITAEYRMGAPGTTMRILLRQNDTNSFTGIWSDNFQRGRREGSVRMTRLK